MNVATRLAPVFLCLASVPLSALAADEPASPGKPNIIFVLADDLGIDGVSCYGADKHHTPRIDALAESGMRFRTCYAAPLCGPSRCLLMTGRYAFRTGGLTNQSWRADGPGAKSADEFPMAKLMKRAGYATGHAGKWRQVGELPSAWGFDEFLTDNTAGGWYWQTKYDKNGQIVKLPEGSYGPDVVQDFTFDFMRRHKDRPFFFYLATHLVHKPTVRTPDTTPGTKNIDKLYDDNIRYVDKQVGDLVDELERLGIRHNTLIIFSGDNGTAAGYPSSVQGRMINGWKGSVLEGGSRVPFIANWPAMMPKGKVVEDIVSFADPYATFAELAGVQPPEGFKTDGHSIAPQLRGEKGKPRDWAYVQLGGHWYVREPGFKLNEAGELFDMSDAPFVEKFIPPPADTPASQAARKRLSAALMELDPAAGKTDRDGGGRKAKLAKAGGLLRSAGPWKSGDSLLREQAPNVDDRTFEITADIEPTGPEGVIIVQGAAARGYALYLTHGKLAFAVREAGQSTTIVAKEPLGTGHFSVKAALHADGALTLSVGGKQVAEGKAPGLISPQPKAGLTVGSSRQQAVGVYPVSAPFEGKVTNVRVTASAVPGVAGGKSGGKKKSGVISIRHGSDYGEAIERKTLLDEFAARAGLNEKECALILAKPGHEGCHVSAVSTLEEVVEFFAGRRKLENALRNEIHFEPIISKATDFGAIRGQEAAKEAAMIAAAGGHNMLRIMSILPYSGKC